MVRVLRYPRLSAASCALAIACALARDLCKGAGLDGLSRVLLFATGLLLALCFVLLSCRFFVDGQGVGVGFLLRVRRTPWSDLAALGALCCNSRRVYLYGLYRGQADFLQMLHRTSVNTFFSFIWYITSEFLLLYSVVTKFWLYFSISSFVIAILLFTNSFINPKKSSLLFNKSLNSLSCLWSVFSSISS